MKRNMLVLGFSALTIFATSCGGDAQAPENKKEETTENKADNSDINSKKPTEQKTNLLADLPTLEKAETSLKEIPKFKGKEVNIFQDITFNGEGYIIAKVQDPENPNNIDQYEFRNGVWGEPQPIQISGSGNMSENVFPLKNVKFATVNTIYNTWKEKAATLEGVTKDLNYISYRLNVIRQKQYWSSGTLETAREKYDFEWNLDGTVKSFKKN